MLARVITRSFSVLSNPPPCAVAAPSSRYPPPTLGGAWRTTREALSFSSTRVRRDTGVHLHRIDDYSNVVRMALLTGKRIKSAPFRVGGHDWQLVYYPTRCGYAAVDLELTFGPWWRPFYSPWNVTAAYSVSILDADGKEALVSKAVGLQSFSWFSSACVMELAKVDELRSALRGAKEDGLLLRCEVTVMKLEEESRIKWYLRQFVK